MVGKKQAGRVAELFAGVGGFRLALEGHRPSKMRGTGWQVVWSNQWEPSTRAQHASACYRRHFGDIGHTCEDIHTVVARAASRPRSIPDIDLVVAGFPCQDYSVARTLSQAAGIKGKKGVLWWDIEKFLRLKRPRFIFLENVDRLLRSPAGQRGRDFGMMLRCLSDLGYLVEWRVVNAAAYGEAQRRPRLFIVGERRPARTSKNPVLQLVTEGVLARALPCRAVDESVPSTIRLPKDRLELSKRHTFSYANAGVMYRGRIWTMNVQARSSPRRKVLGNVLLDGRRVPKGFFIPPSQLPSWRRLKGAKQEPRTASNGFEYLYSEGAIAFPDPVDRPSRTILTGESGSTPSRFKHVIRTRSGRFRRLTPIELERLNGFPDDWTATGMSDSRRAFCMGNALVVGPVRRVGAELAKRLAAANGRASSRRPTA